MIVGTYARSKGRVFTITTKLKGRVIDCERSDSCISKHMESIVHSYSILNPGCPILDTFQVLVIPFAR